MKLNHGKLHLVYIHISDQLIYSQITTPGHLINSFIVRLPHKKPTLLNEM